MAQILGGRFGRFAQALFNLNQQLTLGDVVPDVTPIVDLEHPRPELELFTGNDLFHGTIQAGAVVGQYSYAVFRLPNCGKLAVIESVRASSTSAAFVALGVGGGTLGAAAAEYGQPRDSRNPSLRSAAKFLTGSNAGAIYFTNAARVVVKPANESVELLGGPLVLGPIQNYTGSIVVVQSDTVNAPLYVTFAWRERSIGQQELEA